MKIGDVVNTKVGGPTLVIVGMVPDGDWRCMYWHATEGVFKTVVFPENALVIDGK